MRILNLLAALCVVTLGIAATGVHAQTVPGFSKVFSPDTIVTGGTSTLTFAITNDNTAPVSNLAFSDVLPVGVVIATPANVSSNLARGTVTAPDGGTTISFSGGGIGANTVGTISVDVTSSGIGSYVNVSSDLTSSEGNSGIATDTLTVNPPPPSSLIFSKSFAPASISFGGISTLTFLFDNTAGSTLIADLTFSDNLPSGMLLASPPNPTSTCAASGIYGPLTLSAPAGGDTLTASGGGEVPVGGSCTISVDVVGTNTGVFVNTSSTLVAQENFFSTFFTTVVFNPASASLEVQTASSEATFLKSFTNDPVLAGDTVTLEFLITNLDRGAALTGIGFSDDLTATLTGLVATGLPQTDVCGSGSTLAGTSTITLSDGNLPAEGSCRFSVTLQVPVTAAPGVHANTTSALTADGGTMVDPATDNLTVSVAPIISKTFTDNPALPGGSATLEFTILNPSTTFTATDIGFTDNLTEVLAGLSASGLPASDVCGTGSEISQVADGFSNLLLSLSGGTLAPGADCTFNVSLDVPADATAGSYTNTTSQVSATLDSAVLFGNTATDELVVVSGPRLTKSFTDDPVLAGDTVDLQFNLILSENEPADATGITFSDDLDATMIGLVATGLPLNNVCGAGSLVSGSSLLSLTGGNLATGTSCSFTVTLQVPASATSGAYPNTTSTVSADMGGEAVTTAAATDTLNVAGLTALKSFTDDPVAPGQTVTLEFTITNESVSISATGIQMTDDLASVLPGTPDLSPTDLPKNDVCGAGSTLTQFGSTLALIGGSLPVGTSCTFDTVLDVPAAAPIGQHRNVISSLSSNELPGASNSAFDDLVIIDPLVLTKSFSDDPAVPGGTVNLEFSLANLLANDTITGISFSDDLGAVLSGLTATGLPTTPCGAGSTLSGSSFLSFTGGTLAGGDSCTFSATLQVPGSATAGDYLNTTSIPSGSIGGLTVSASQAASDELMVVDPPVSITTIPAIQGSGDRSPFENQIVTTEGTVTADFRPDNFLQTYASLRGFFIQDSLGDGDPATSDGLFVFLPSDNAAWTNFSVSTGDQLRVTGTVREDVGANNVDRRDFTLLDSITDIQVLSTGTRIPAQAVPLPTLVDGDLERYESMLVSIDPNATMSITETTLLGQYGQLSLSSVDDAAQAGRLFEPTGQQSPGSAGAIAQADENTRRLLILDDGKDDRPEGDYRNPVPYLGSIGAITPVRPDDLVSNLVGILDYGRIDATPQSQPNTIARNYRLQPTETPLFNPINTRPVAPDPVGGSVRVAGVDLNNYFTTLNPGGGDMSCGVPAGSEPCRGANDVVELQRQQEKLLIALLELDADIISLSEVENNGFGPSSAIQSLVDLLNAASGAGTYDMVTPATATLGEDAISVGLIYKPAVVVEVGTAATLATGAFAPGNSLLQGGDGGLSRQPLAQTFQDLSSGETFSVVANHFVEKDAGGTPTGGNDPANSDGQGAWNQRRTEAANQLAAWLATDPTAAGDTDFLIIGNLGAYAQEDPIAALAGSGYSDLINDFLSSSAYTAVGTHQSAYPHPALASTDLDSQVTGVAVYHINADEPKVLDYNNENISSQYFFSDAYRSSDHDPILVGIDLVAPPSVIDGTPGRDTLVGTPANDTITGFANRDTLTGAAGNDRFVYTSVVDRSDIITDFEVGIDVIVLTGLFTSLGIMPADYNDAVAQGFIQFRTSRASAVVMIDPDGSAGSARAYAFIITVGVGVAALDNAVNFEL